MISFENSLTQEVNPQHPKSATRGHHLWDISPVGAPGHAVLSGGCVRPDPETSGQHEVPTDRETFGANGRFMNPDMASKFFQED